ncbi:hypothetical protein STEG23_025291 [Scotinomys teguina]
MDSPQRSPAAGEVYGVNSRKFPRKHILVLFGDGPGLLSNRCLPNTLFTVHSQAEGPAEESGSSEKPLPGKESAVITVMKIYNEKEKSEQGKIFEEKKDIMKWNGAESSVQDE